MRRLCFGLTPEHLRSECIRSHDSLKFSNPFKRSKWTRQQPSLEPTTDELNRFKENVAAIACPACEQETLEVQSYSQGPTDWEATISCKNCDLNGVANKTGFSFTDLCSKGKAVKTFKPKTPETPPEDQPPPHPNDEAPPA